MLLEAFGGFLTLFRGGPRIMSRDFRIKTYFALSKLVFIPFRFLLVCFTYLSSLVFKLSKSFQKSVHTFSTKAFIRKYYLNKNTQKIIQAKGVVQQAPRIMSRDFRLKTYFA